MDTFVETRGNFWGIWYDLLEQSLHCANGIQLRLTQAVIANGVIIACFLQYWNGLPESEKLKWDVMVPSGQNKH